MRGEPQYRCLECADRWPGGGGPIVDGADVILSGRDDDGAHWLRPQSVAFTLLAEQVVTRDVALWSGSFIEVFARLGIGEHATRATLVRMAQRKLLCRHREGRRVYFSATPRCRKVLEDGHRRIWDVGAVNTDVTAGWTILTFSLPESWQRERHHLRSRLSWAGLGSLHPGVWIGPTPPDVVVPLLHEVGLYGHVHVFPLQVTGVRDLAAVAREAFDLDGLADSYERFLRGWQDYPDDAPADDPLALTLRLSTEWLQVVGNDPQVPIHLLPANWPAVAAQKRFRALHAANFPAATALADELFETIALDARRDQTG